MSCKQAALNCILYEPDAPEEVDSTLFQLLDFGAQVKLVVEADALIPELRSIPCCDYLIMRGQHVSEVRKIFDGKFHDRSVSSSLGQGKILILREPNLSAVVSESVGFPEP